MKRRDVLKGAVVAAGAAVVGLPSEAEAGMTAEGGPLRSVTDSHGFDGKPVVMDVFPDEKGKFALNFQHAVQAWRFNTQELFRPVGKMTWEPFLKDGAPWLIHPSWDPPSEDNPAVLFSNTREVFRDGRWQLIDRALNLRGMGYWRQEYGPQFKGMLDGGGMSPGTSHWRMFHRVAREHLYRVRVRFEVISLATLDRHSDGEYGQLELEALVLEDLRKADKITPRTYYEKRSGRFDRLSQLEAEATG